MAEDEDEDEVEELVDITVVDDPVVFSVASRSPSDLPNARRDRARWETHNKPASKARPKAPCQGRWNQSTQGRWSNENVGDSSMKGERTPICWRTALV